MEVVSRLLDTKGAAAYFSMTVPAFRKLYWSHGLPFIGVGKGYRFDLRDLDKLVDKLKTKK